jgi:hypothetical protein
MHIDRMARRVASRYLRAQARKRALRMKTLTKLLDKGGKFGIISAYRPGSKSENKRRHGELLADLQRLGYRKWDEAKSHWEGAKEKSLLIPNIKPKDLFALGEKYDQDATIYKSADGVLGMYFPAGFAYVAIDPEGDPNFEMAEGQEMYTKPNRDWSFNFGFLWGEKIPWDKRTPLNKGQVAQMALPDAA